MSKRPRLRLLPKPRSRGEDVATSSKRALLAAGNAFAAAMDFFAELEKGRDMGDAAEKALSKANKRAVAIRRAEAETDEGDGGS